MVQDAMISANVQVSPETHRQLPCNGKGSPMLGEVRRVPPVRSDAPWVPVFGAPTADDAL